MADDPSYESIKGRLDEVPCAYRLYPQCLSALGMLTGRNLLAEVAERITRRIGGHAEPGWSEQFERDFDTYGLYEAILYFHTYPFEPQDIDFVIDACGMYREMASLYLNHRSRLETSDDPRVQAHMATVRHKGAQTQHVERFSVTPRPRPSMIDAPAAPPPVPGYQRRILVGDDMRALYGALGVDSSRGPCNLAEELIEYLSMRYLFSGLPGLQLVFSEVADLLDERGIDPFGAEGQYVLDSVRDGTEQELFGGFIRLVDCIECREEYEPGLSLDEVNEYLVQGGWTCDRCREARSAGSG